VPYTEKLQYLSKQLLAAKKLPQEAFLKTILRKEGNCWSDFYKYVKRREGSRENIPTIKDGNGLKITDATEKQMRLTLTIRQFSAARTIFLMYRVEIQASHSPLIVKSLGEGLKR